MIPHQRRSSLLIVSCALLGLFAAGCAVETHGASTGSSEGLQTITILDGNDADRWSIRLDVLRDGATVDSQIFAAERFRFPGELPLLGTQRFFSLTPGLYEVVATAVDQDGVESETCGNASTMTEVRSGHASELSLTIPCQRSEEAQPKRYWPGPWVAVSDAPSISNISVRPRWFIDTCDVAEIVVTATAQDGGPLTYDWSVWSFRRSRFATLADDGERATFSATRQGIYFVRVVVKDTRRRRSSVAIPIFVFRSRGSGTCENQIDLQLSESRVVMTPGAAVDVGVLLAGGFHGPATLDVSGAPAGTTAMVGAIDALGTADLTLTVDADAPAQDFTIAVRAEANGRDDTETLAVSVQQPGQMATNVEEFAPGVNGVVKTLNMNGVDVVYEVIDGMAIVNGDVVLGSARALEAAFGAATPLATEEVRSRLTASTTKADTSGVPVIDKPEVLKSARCNFGFNTDFSCNVWNNGVIGYSFANDWDEFESDPTIDANALMRGRIEQAIDWWEDETTLRFVRRSTGERVDFRDGGGCSSTIGRAVTTGFDSQSIALNEDGCSNTGTMAHEIGHAIGLYHEQSRDDRNDNVIVDFGRVEDAKLHNFFQFGEFERDEGVYNYDSILHYPPWAFSRNRPACEDSGIIADCTLRALAGDPPLLSYPAGQRSGLSEGDILGASVLYPPAFTIVGATDGQAGDSFLLGLQQTTPLPLNPRTERFFWTSSLVAGDVATGQSFGFDASDLPNGPQIITAEFRVADQVVASASVAINLVNGAPAVTLAPNNGSSTQDLNLLFTVTASITDDEDGSCDPPACTLTWDPPPFSTMGRSATYRPQTVGPLTIMVTVVDGAGGVGAAELTVNVANSPPTAVIVSPPSNVNVTLGTDLMLEGRGDDINSPGGQLACSRLAWSSSDPSDSFTPGQFGCQPTVQFGGPGPRTLILTASDLLGALSTDTVMVNVASCGPAGCPPIGFFSLSDPPYVIEQPLELRYTAGSADSQGLGITFFARRPGSPSPTISSFSLLNGSTPVTGVVTWTPEDDIPSWPNCVTEPREYEIVLQVVDDELRLTETSTTIMLACEFI